MAIFRVEKWYCFEVRTAAIFTAIVGIVLSWILLLGSLFGGMKIIRAIVSALDFKGLNKAGTVILFRTN